MTKEHTPTPWKVGAKHTVGFVSIEDDQSYGMTIPFIDVYGTNPEANAAHIVKCVNTHDELVEALRKCGMLLEHGGFDLEFIDSALEKAGAL